MLKYRFFRKNKRVELQEGGKVLVGLSENYIYFWNHKRKKLIRTVAKNKKHNSMQVSERGDRCATSDYDGSWNRNEVDMYVLLSRKAQKDIKNAEFESSQYVAQLLEKYKCTQEPVKVDDFNDFVCLPPSVRSHLIDGRWIDESSSALITAKETIVNDVKKKRTQLLKKAVFKEKMKLLLPSFRTHSNVQENKASIGLLSGVVASLQSH